MFFTLGIDPSLRRTGYAILGCEDGETTKNGLTYPTLTFDVSIGCGVIDTPKKTYPDTGSALVALHRDLKDRLAEATPPKMVKNCVILSPYVRKNIKVALDLGAASGVAFIAAYDKAHFTTFMHDSQARRALGIVGRTKSDIHKWFGSKYGYSEQLNRISWDPDIIDALIAAHAAAFMTWGEHE